MASHGKQCSKYSTICDKKGRARTRARGLAASTDTAEGYRLYVVGGSELSKGMAVGILTHRTLQPLSDALLKLHLSHTVITYTRLCCRASSYAPFPHTAALMEGVPEQASPSMAEPGIDAVPATDAQGLTCTEQLPRDVTPVVTAEFEAAGSEVGASAAAEPAGTEPDSHANAHQASETEAPPSQEADQLEQELQADPVPAQQQEDVQDQQDPPQQQQESAQQLEEQSASSNADAASDIAQQRGSSSAQLSSSARPSRSSSNRPGTAAAARVSPADAEAAAATAEQVRGSLRHVLSLAASKRSNLHLLEDGTLAMAAGCAVLLLHLPTMQQRFLPGRDGGGVAAVAVHPNRQLFLVAEKCRSRAPNM